MERNHFTFDAEAKLANLPLMVDFVTEKIGEFHPGSRSIHQVQVAVDEACTNVINHAYAEYPGTIHIELEIARDELVIVIKDNGKGFDPSNIPDPDLDSDWEDRKIGGLGVHLMTKLMDSVSYKTDPEQGNELKMTKRLSGAPGAG